MNAMLVLIFAIIVLVAGYVLYGGWLATSLVLSVKGKVVAIAGGAATAANLLQLVIAVLLMILAIVLAVKGTKVIFGKKKVTAE